MEKDVVLSERSIFCGDVILSAEDGTFFGQMRFCPSQTRCFLPGRDFFTQTERKSCFWGRQRAERCSGSNRSPQKKQNDHLVVLFCSNFRCGLGDQPILEQ
jgi:hypothetical protein